MTFIEYIKKLFKSKDKMEKLNGNPKSERLTYINSEEEILKQQIKEYEIWYNGDSSELLNYYTNMEIRGNAREPIYNRNKEFYFWGISAQETKIKRVHSGLPKVIVDTLCNVIGTPVIECADAKDNAILQNILEENTFSALLNQQARPFTLVEGYGAFKPIWDKKLSDHPIIQFYDAKDTEFIIEKSIITGIIYKDYYKYQNKDYILTESRFVKDGNTNVVYKLARQTSENEVEPVSLDTIPELAHLPEEGYTIEGFKEILGVPCRYYFNPNNKGYGKSIFNSKIDIFDDLDQSLSQRSQTCRVSTPTEYYPVDLLERDRNGEVVMPSVYNRQFIKKDSIPNGDGVSNGDIQTTQPVLNFEQYSNEQKELLSLACAGIISMPTLGMDISKKDNAEAQREKEKVTIMTRNNIIDMETSIIKKLCKILLVLQEYMDTGKITLKKYDISVKYSEFANPSFENLSQVLTPMYTSGAISTEMYVEKLYGDSLSEEEKQQEITWLEERSKQDNLEMGDFDLNGADENSIRELAGQEEQPQE